MKHMGAAYCKQNQLELNFDEVVSFTDAAKELINYVVNNSHHDRDGAILYLDKSASPNWRLK